MAKYKVLGAKGYDFKDDKGERKTYKVENNGKITTPMNY